MDTIVSALHAFDSVGTEYIAHPETEVKAVAGLQAELNKIIKAITVSGGTITLTKTDGTTFTATINNASTSVNGLMSSNDKTKLDGIATNANNYSLPNATSSTLGGVKIGSNISVSGGTISLTKDNVTSALGYTPGTGSGSVTGVKGNSESSYRTGNVNLTAANIGAAATSHTHSEYAASSHNHSADNITSGTLPVARGGTGQTSLDGVTVGIAKSWSYKNLQNVNCDELSNNGMYYLTYYSNGPITDGGSASAILITYHGDVPNTVIFQIMKPEKNALGGSLDNYVYYRHFWGGWKAWMKITAT